MFGKPNFKKQKKLRLGVFKNILEFFPKIVFKNSHCPENPKDSSMLAKRFVSGRNREGASMETNKKKVA